MYIPIILGTAREGRQSEKVSSFLLEEIIKNNIESEIIDVRDYRIEATDNTGKSPQAQKLSEKIIKADALIIVSPEYNHGYPGELKMMLDMLYKEYTNKKVGFCGVSIGGLGGARVVEQLRLISIQYGMIPIREAVYFSTVQNLFDENGKIKDESYQGKVKTLINELIS
jgi:NAD(P)H-dependent FMN reductase